jgi:hypothetical protein
VARRQSVKSELLKNPLAECVRGLMFLSSQYTDFQNGCKTKVLAASRIPSLNGNVL